MHLPTTLLEPLLEPPPGTPLDQVNASDDRSASALKEKVERAMESKSVFGDKRPNLVILDEIDGADNKEAIEALINIVKVTKTTHENDSFISFFSLFFSVCLKS
jgi:hypothetical protein